MFKEHSYCVDVNEKKLFYSMWCRSHLIGTCHFEITSPAVNWLLQFNLLLKSQKFNLLLKISLKLLIVISNQTTTPSVKRKCKMNR